MHFQSKQKQNNPSRFLNSNCPGERIWNHNWSGISFCHVVITNGLGITFLVLHKPAPPICWINIHLMYGFAIHVCQLTSQNKVDHYIEITIICRGALKVMGICYLPWNKHPKNALKITDHPKKRELFYLQNQFQVQTRCFFQGGVVLLSYHTSRQHCSKLCASLENDSFWTHQVVC